MWNHACGTHNVWNSMRGLCLCVRGSYVWSPMCAEPNVWDPMRVELDVWDPAYVEPYVRIPKRSKPRAMAVQAPTGKSDAPGIQ